MDAQQALDQVKQGITQVAKEAAGMEDAGEAGDAGDAGETYGMDEAALATMGDAGAPPAALVTVPSIEEGLRVLAREKALTDKTGAQLVHHIVRHEKAHAHKKGHELGFRRGLRHGLGRGGIAMPGRMHPNEVLPDDRVFWRRGADMNRWRWDIIARYKELHPGGIDVWPGFYWGTLQVPLSVEGPTTNPLFVLNVPPPSGSNANPLIDSCFDMAIGDVEPQWFGGPHVLDLSDTNVQNPGAFLYPDQLMIIEAVSASLQAIRIQYFPVTSPQTIPAGMFTALLPLPNNPATIGMLAGTNPVWDRGALVLPVEFFNQFSDVSELAQAIAMVTTIAFAWDDRGAGGQENIAIKPITRMSAVPGSARQGVQETPGGVPCLDLPKGYIWCRDRQFQATEDSGGNGLFSAQLRQSASFAFPFTPVASLFGTSTPVPLGVALEWQLAVHGTALNPTRSTLDRANPRRRQ